MLSSAQISDIRQVVMGMDAYLRNELMPLISSSTSFDIMRDCPIIVEGVQKLQSFNVMYTARQRSALDDLTSLLQQKINVLLDALREFVAGRTADRPEFDAARSLAIVNEKHRDLCNAFTNGGGIFLSTISPSPSDRPASADEMQRLSVFLCYRRSDTQAFVDRLYSEISTKFTDVFRDIDSIRAGDDFEKLVHDRLRETDVVIVVIGKGWLAKPLLGKPRLFGRADYVRAEIEAALASKARVVPLLCDAASMPQKSAVPQTISAVCNLSALRLRPDPDFRGDVERLVNHISVSSQNS